MRILFFIDCLECGGAQRQMVTMAKGFQRRGHEIRFLTYHPAGHFLPELEEAGISCACLRKSGYLGRILQVRRVLRQGWQDVVLAFLEAPVVYAELAGPFYRKWGLVVGERSAHPETVKGRRRWLRAGHRFADRIVANSRTNRLMLERAWPRLRPKLATIYNAVDLNHFRPSPPNAASGRAGSQLNMVVFASYQGLKNMMGLAQALYLLQQRGKYVVVDWYGGRAPNEQALREASAYVKANGLAAALRFHPPIRDVEPVYQRADVVGLFSFYEGLPNSVAEGMACGKPILMTDVCDAKYLVEDGRNGFLCDPRSPASIADSVLKMMSLNNQERQRMGLVSRRRAEQLFDPEVCLTKYEKILDSAVHKTALRSDDADAEGLPAPWVASGRG